MKGFNLKIEFIRLKQIFNPIGNNSKWIQFLKMVDNLYFWMKGDLQLEDLKQRLNIEKLNETERKGIHDFMIKWIDYRINLMKEIRNEKGI